MKPGKAAINKYALGRNVAAFIGKVGYISAASDFAWNFIHCAFS
jgi:hypothetical protein